jgi:hypothetical protein
MIAALAIGCVNGLLVAVGDAIACRRSGSLFVFQGLLRRYGAFFYALISNMRQDPIAP